MSPALPKFYYVYALKSINRNRPYVGCTSDLVERFDEHNRAGVFPVRIIFP